MWLASDLTGSPVWGRCAGTVFDQFECVGYGPCTVTVGARKGKRRSHYYNLNAPNDGGVWCAHQCASISTCAGYYSGQKGSGMGNTNTMCSVYFETGSQVQKPRSMIRHANEWAFYGSLSHQYEGPITTAGNTNIAAHKCGGAIKDQKCYRKGPRTLFLPFSHLDRLSL